MMRACWMRVVESPDARACIVCGRSIPQAVEGDFVAAVVAENELVGIVGGCCLTPTTRAELARLRATDGVRG